MFHVPITGVKLAGFLSVPAAVGLQVQRSDDTEDKARNRLRTYHANVDAVIGYYKEQLVEVRDHSL